MTTEDQGENTPEPEEVAPKRRGSQLIRGLIGIGLIGLAVAAVVFAFQIPNGPDPEELRSDLAKSWKTASKDAAPGVDFEMKLRGDFKGSKFTMVFDHQGEVVLRDSCYESKSDYLVLSDGSIAVEDLSQPELLEASVGCEEPSTRSLYWTSSLDYGENGWTARDVAGKPLLEKIQEDRIEASLESDLE